MQPRLRVSRAWRHDFPQHVTTCGDVSKRFAPCRGAAQPVRRLQPADRSGRVMLNGIDLDRATAARAFGEAFFNLLRRGADGSLTLSTDRWRLEAATPEAFHFAAQAEEAPDLVVRMVDVERLVWDRLPKQHVRSQIRIQLVNGDLLTFSGSVDESALPPAP